MPSSSVVLACLLFIAAIARFDLIQREGIMPMNGDGQILVGKDEEEMGLVSRRVERKLLSKRNQ